MADFDPPFANTGDRRLANNDEKQLGFGCGPFDLSLFNGIVWQLQAELNELHDEAGITPNDSTSRTTVDAILALIAAATGGGGSSDYVLMTQARTRFPIYPEVSNIDGKIVMTSPAAGTVRLPGGVNFLHRGVFTVATVQTDFATLASKIYHMRWDPTNGYRLRDLADVAYNPTAAAETDIRFDSSYDDMLIARVITNSSNVATITNLANKNHLTNDFILSGPAVSFPAASYNQPWSVPVEWARSPVFDVAFQAIYDNQGAQSFDKDWNVAYLVRTRYVISGVIIANHVSSAPVIAGLMIAR